MTTNTEKRRAGFEAWAREHPYLGIIMCRAESFKQRSGFRYPLPDIEIAWQAYNAALDSVCVELPEGFADCYGVYYSDEEIQQAISAAGIRYK